MSKPFFCSPNAWERILAYWQPQADAGINLCEAVCSTNALGAFSELNDVNEKLAVFSACLASLINA